MKSFHSSATVTDQAKPAEHPGILLKDATSWNGLKEGDWRGDNLGIQNEQQQLLLLQSVLGTSIYIEYMISFSREKIHHYSSQNCGHPVQLYNMFSSLASIFTDLGIQEHQSRSINFASYLCGPHDAVSQIQWTATWQRDIRDTIRGQNILQASMIEVPKLRG